MAFAVTDLQDLLTLLREHPEWRDEVRRELLSEEYQPLPQLVREQGEELGNAMRAIEKMAESIASSNARADGLIAESNARTDALIADSHARTDAIIAESNARTDALIADLTAKIADSNIRTDAAVADLKLANQRIDGRLGNLEGWSYELRYQLNAGSRLGRKLRRAEVVSLGHLAPVLDALDRGDLDDHEWEELVALDLLVRGRVGKGPDAPERYAAIEVSVTVDYNDVLRAHKRARLLERAGLAVDAYVAGRKITDDAQEKARDLGVTVLLDRVA